MITRTSPVWLPPPELLPDARSALRGAAEALRGAAEGRPDPGDGPGAASGSGADLRPGAAELLADRREAAYDAHFGVARTSRDHARPAAGTAADHRRGERLAPRRRPGQALLLTTRVQGRTVLRMCTVNPATTTADIDATLELVVRVVRQAWSAGRLD